MLPNLEKLRTCRKIWSKCAPLPSATIGGCTAVRNGKIFLCGGLTRNVDYLAHVHIYYPGNDKWYRITDCPQYYCSCAVINDNFTIIGGCSNIDNAVTNLLWSYSTTTKKWEQLLQPMPTKRSLTTSQVYDDRLIVCGGLLADTSASDAVEVLDLATKEWSKVQSIPDKLCRANSTVCDDIMYLVGGIEDGLMATSKVYKVHLPSLLQSKARTSPVWEFVRNTPSCHSAVASLSGHVVVIGGQLKQRAISSLFLYNPSSNCWEFLGDMPVSRAHCRAVLLDGKIIVMGGFTDGRDPTKSSVVTVETLECIM